MPAAETSDYRKPYKILSLDGGGSWALIQAKVLKDLGYKTGHQVLNDFDLVAANSGGSLVLGGLVANMELGEIAEVFRNEQNRKDVFFEKTGLHSINKGFDENRIFPKYSTQDKLVGLQRIFTEKSRLSSEFNDEHIQGIKKRLGFKADLLVPAYDYESKRGKIFRSNIKSKAKLPGDEKERCRFVQVMHASSNAPIRFFDKPATVNFDDADGNTLRLGKFWDGAVAGYNNPILLAVTEALANGIKPTDIVALSIGAGTVRVMDKHVKKAHAGSLFPGGPFKSDDLEPAGEAVASASPPWIDALLAEETDADRTLILDLAHRLGDTGDADFLALMPMMSASSPTNPIVRVYNFVRNFVRSWTMKIFRRNLYVQAKRLLLDYTRDEIERYFKDLAKMTTTILDDPPDSASYMAYVALTNGRAHDTNGRAHDECDDDSPLVRLNPFIRYNMEGNKLSVPKELGQDKFDKLIKMGMDALKKDEVELIEELTKLWMNDLVPNQPVRSFGEAFQRCANGHETYGEAKEHWKKISARN